MSESRQKSSFQRREELWLNGYAVFAVTFMKGIHLLKSARFARFLQRSSSSRKMR
jgi:hypothetical protein